MSLKSGAPRTKKWPRYCFYAAVVLINRAIGGIDASLRTALQFLSAAVVLLPYVLLGDGVMLYTLDGIGWAALLCVGFLHTGVTYAVYFSALHGISGQEAALLSYIDPLVAVLLSVFVLGEDISALQLLGGILILGASVINEIAAVRKKK